MKQIILLLTFFSLSLVALAQKSAINFNYNVDKSGIAIKGYDPVSYMYGEEPVKGNKNYAFTINGVTYLFTNAKNRDMFKMNPEKYEPAYGGWCAYAMGNSGEKVEIDPETFKIIEGKTYLFYNFYFTNTLKDWNKDEKNLKSKAELNWRKYIK